MPITVVIGAQWGDEGKGKIVDLASEKADVVARYQGGANAGHTICWDDKTIVLHQVPSGIFQENAQCVIGNGVVLDPVAVMEEIQTVRDLGYDPSGRLFISHNAHLIMPYHKRLDVEKEAAKKKTDNAIGTTGRGIGPCYVDKFARTGIRVVDLLDRDVLAKKLRVQIEAKNHLLSAVYGAEKLDEKEMIEEYVEFDQVIDPYVTDTSVLLNDALSEGKEVLAEGAQGSLLDVDFGTYPYVTSSHPTVGGCAVGLGVPTTAIKRIVGIVKAYSTRVGNGPMPTELTDDIGNQLQTVGAEFGATTGRPRRCGWLDLVALRYTTMINGFTELAITKLDVLSGLKELKIATAYTTSTKRYDRFPSETHTLEQVQPEYVTMPGWEEDIAGATDFDALPTQVGDYLEFISDFVGVPVSYISTGPKRSETILRS